MIEERLRRKLTEIHDITQDPHMAPIDKIDNIAATAASALSAEAGRADDGAASDEWNNGCDFAMEQLCKVLGVDPKAVNWDAATETAEGDVRSIIGNVLEASSLSSHHHQSTHHQQEK